MVTYKPLKIKLEKLITPIYAPFDWVDDGHRDWSAGWHVDGWAQSQNNKIYLPKQKLLARNKTQYNIKVFPEAQYKPLTNNLERVIEYAKAKSELEKKLL